MKAEEFCQALLDESYNYYTGVPCSFFKGVINYSQEDARVRYFMAANEGAAVALAAGAYWAGSRPVVMIQNSGLGNMVNPLTSLNYIYNVPTLLLVSGRAYKVDDEPQHELMGRTTHDFLRLMEIPVEDAALEVGAFREQLARLSKDMWQSKRQALWLFVRARLIIIRCLLGLSRLIL